MRTNFIKVPICEVCGNEFDPAEAEKELAAVHEHVDRYYAGENTVVPTDEEFAAVEGKIGHWDCFLESLPDR